MSGGMDCCTVSDQEDNVAVMDISNIDYKENEVSKNDTCISITSSKDEAWSKVDDLNPYANKEETNSSCSEMFMSGGMDCRTVSDTEDNVAVMDISNIDYKENEVSEMYFYRNSRIEYDVDSMYSMSESLSQGLKVYSDTSTVQMSSYMNRQRILHKSRFKHMLSLPTKKKWEEEESSRLIVIKIDRYKNMHLADFFVGNTKFSVFVVDMRFESSNGNSYFSKLTAFMLSTVLNATFSRMTKPENQKRYGHKTLTEIGKFNRFYHADKGSYKSVSNCMGMSTFDDFISAYEDTLKTIKQSDVKYKDKQEEKELEHYARSISKEAIEFSDSTCYFIFSAGTKCSFTSKTIWEGDKSIEEHFNSIDRTKKKLSKKGVHRSLSAKEQFERKSSGLRLLDIKHLYKFHQIKANNELRKILEKTVFRVGSEEIFDVVNVYVDVGCEISCTENGYSYLFHKKESMNELRSCFKRMNLGEEEDDQYVMVDKLFENRDNRSDECDDKDYESVSTTTTTNEDEDLFLDYFEEDIVMKEEEENEEEEVKHKKLKVSKEQRDKEDKVKKEVKVEGEKNVFLGTKEEYDLKDSKNYTCSLDWDTWDESTSTKTAYSNFTKSKKLVSYPDYLSAIYTDLHTGGICQGRKTKRIEYWNDDSPRAATKGFGIMVDEDARYCGCQVYIPQFRAMLSKKEMVTEYPKLQYFSTNVLNFMLPKEQRTMSTKDCWKKLRKQMDVVDNIPVSEDHFQRYSSSLSARTEFFCRYKKSWVENLTWPCFEKCLRRVKKIEFTKFVEISLRYKVEVLKKVFSEKKDSASIESLMEKLSAEAKLAVLECSEFLEQLLVMKSSTMKTWKYLNKVFKEKGRIFIPSSEQCTLSIEDKSLTGLLYGLHLKTMRLGEAEWAVRFRNELLNRYKKKGIGEEELKIVESMWKNLRFRRSRISNLVHRSFIDTLVRLFHVFSQRGEMYLVLCFHC